MKWFYEINNKWFKFNKQCADYFNNCVKSKQPACCIMEKKSNYYNYGSLIHIDFIIKTMYRENDIFKQVKLYNNCNYNYSINNNFIPVCCKIKSMRSQPNQTDEIISVALCYHSHECHNRFCVIHNKQTSNFTFKKYNLH